MKFNTLRNILLSVTTAVALASCGSAKQGANTATYTPQRNATELKLDKEVAALASTYRTDWQSVKMSMDIDLESPMSIGLGGNITMLRNKAIYISLRKFGFEVAALWLTTDSVFAKVKINKRYVAEGLNTLLKGFPATVGNVQSLLLGQAFAPGTESFSKNSFNTLSANDKDMPSVWLMTPITDLRGAEATFVIDGAESPSLLALQVDASGNSVQCIWSDTTKDTPAGNVATKSEWSGKVGKMAVKASLSLNAAKATWNKNTDIPRWSTPSGYRKISLSEMLKSL